MSSGGRNGCRLASTEAPPLPRNCAGELLFVVVNTPPGSLAAAASRALPHWLPRRTRAVWLQSLSSLRGGWVSLVFPATKSKDHNKLQLRENRETSFACYRSSLAASQHSLPPTGGRLSESQACSVPSPWQCTISGTFY